MHLLYRLFLTTLFILSLIETSNACPMCFTKDSKTAVQAYLGTTFGMIALLFILLGGFAYFIIKKLKQNENASED